jgi:ABC-type transport system involved in cytochrome bd biosynthesis fused ATPase/permease subunit
MANKNKRYNPEFAGEKKSLSSRVANALHINPNAMAETMSYLIAFVALIIVYIANAHYHVKTLRDINQTRENLKEIQSEYVSLKAELATKTKASEIATKLKESKIKERRQPPFIIKKEK